jgi:hypothetical protein
MDYLNLHSAITCSSSAYIVPERWSARRAAAAHGLSLIGVDWSVPRTTTRVAVAGNALRHAEDVCTPATSA